MTGFLINKKSIKYLELHSGLAFTADLYLNGKKVGTIENGGNGGETFAHIVNRVRKLFTKEAAMWGLVTDEAYCNCLMDFAEGVSDSKSGQ